MYAKDDRGSAHDGPRSGGDWLVGGGEMGKVVRTLDWAATPLGPLDSWPQSLRTTVDLCMASNFPISVAWGPKHVQLYNDGYWLICGAKHPGSMGQDFTECWASAWPIIGDAFERALTGEASFLENQRMFFDRNGYLEETFFTFSFSPIRDETGAVGGLFHPVTETTATMLAERRTRALRDLADRASNAQFVEEALGAAAGSLASCELDLPFVLFYAIDPQGKEARLIASSGLPPGSEASPLTVDLDAAEIPWPLGSVERSGEGTQVVDLEARCGPLACEPYPEPPKIALVLPIKPPGCVRPIAIVVAGVSPRLPLNDAYRAFYDLLAAGVTTAVADARAHEDEKKRAEALAELDLAKTAFFSNVSHEFRTPLTLVLGPLEDELAERDAPLPAERRERLETAHRNTLRLLKLVNTLLNFSRAEAGRAHASFEPCDLAADTEELASVFRSAVEKAGLTLTVDCAPLPEPIYVDRSMWEKIVLNLLSNALKHTFEGGVRVELRWLGDHAELTVADTGIGVSNEELPRLFERFHRVRGARSRTHEGTGIGLALVRQLAELHGGGVEVASEEGKGTAFTVTVPGGTDHLPRDRVSALGRRASEPAQASAYVEESLGWVQPERPSAGSSRPIAGVGDNRPLVLLADDNAGMRTYVARLLAGRYEVVAAPDGAAALAAASERTPDLVLTDVMMPGLDGFGLLRALRGHDATRTVPVIFLSARAGEDASAEGLDAGADDYMVKPFTARDLLARVKTHLELARVRREWGNELKLREAYQRTDAALRSSEARLRKVIDSAIIGVTRMNLDNRVLMHANDAFLRITGYTREAVLNGEVTISGITPPEWQRLDEQAYAVLRASGGLAMREKEYIHKDGHKVPVLVGAAMLDERECVGYIADISDLKRTEEALRKSQAHFAALYGSGMIGIVASDERGEITDANDTFMTMVGYERHDLAAGGLRLSELTPAEWRHRSALAIGQLRERGFAHTWEAELVRKDGLRVPVLLGLAAVDARANICLVVDLTEQRRAEEASARLEITANREVAERQRAQEALRQTEEQLRQAQKMEAVGRLAGGVAHDFNNILSVVLSYSEMALSETSPEDPIHVDLMEIRKAGRRAADLTRQLLMFSRQQVLELKVLDLNQLLSGMERMLRRLVGEDVELISIPGVRLGRVRVDPGSIEQVIMNLVVNARDAMPVGGSITIETENTTLVEGAWAPEHLGAKPGLHVVLSIRDAGTGMDRATLARMFEPFFTTKGIGKGTGLGLSTVFGIVQQSEGSIWVQSELGKGTTIKVYLPIAESALDDVRLQTAPSTLRGSETILLVEDEEPVRTVARDILERQGYRVLEAESGGDALELCNSYAGSIDLLLSDVVMPKMSGPELARRLAKFRPTAKVLYMSGYTEDAMLRHGALSAGIEFIQKPFTPEMMSRRVREVLEEKERAFPLNS
jgi:PAS domain S-box-containing protein